MRGIFPACANVSLSDPVFFVFQHAVITTQPTDTDCLQAALTAKTAYSTDMAKRAELRMLKVLEWSLHPVTAQELVFAFISVKGMDKSDSVLSELLQMLLDLTLLGKSRQPKSSPKSAPLYLLCFRPM